MGFDFESLGRDWAVSVTDLALSVTAFWGAQHALATPSGSGGRSVLSNVLRNVGSFFLSSVASSNNGAIDELALVSASFASFGICAGLGFIRWGFAPFNRQLNRVYGHMIEVTKCCNIPFLVLNLISQPYATKAQIFFSLIVVYGATKFARLTDKQIDLIQKVMTIAPLVCLIFQAVAVSVPMDALRISTVLAFLLVPPTVEKAGVPLFHILMCVIVWLLESARTGALIRSF